MELLERQDGLVTTAQLLPFLFNMQADIEQLMVDTGRRFKTLALIPEAHVGIASIHVDTWIAASIVEMLYPGRIPELRTYPGKLRYLQEHENRAMVLDCLFDRRKVGKLRREVDHDLPGRQRMKREWTLSVTTDGVAASVHFLTRKWAVAAIGDNIADGQGRGASEAAPPLRHRHPAHPNEGEGGGEEARGAGDQMAEMWPRHLSAIDPGIKTIVAVKRLDRDRRAPGLAIGRGQYMHESGMSDRQRKRGPESTWHQRRIAWIANAMAGAPSSKSASTNDFLQYLAMLGNVWNNW